MMRAYVSTLIELERRGASLRRFIPRHLTFDQISTIASLATRVVCLLMVQT